MPFRIKPLITQRTKVVQIWLHGMTHIMALCEWGRQVMILNGVEASRLSVVRHALAVKGMEMESGVNGISTSVPRLGFFGRMDSTKGLHILVEALSLVPDLPMELHAHLIKDSNALDGMSQLLVQMQRDKRIHLHDAVTPDEVVSTMSRYDAVAVPSIWLETGPLVVLEAFAAGVPVLGSDLGGIAEWVRHEVDGILVPSGDSRAWSAVLSRWSQDADLRETLRKSVRPPPLMNRLAREVQDIYNKAIGRA